MISHPPFRKRFPDLEPGPAVGVAWYTEEEWARVKQAAVDAPRFEATFAEWLTMIEETFARMQEAGARAEKVLISADELLAWCRTHERPNNAAARAAYVAHVMRLRYEVLGPGRSS